MTGKGPKILFVDDDPQVLDAYRRTFRKDFNVHTSQGPVDGLAAIAETGPFFVVISDLRMPGMDGIEFFSQLKARCPDTVRIMLTGYADIAAAMSAVNQGHVFRFLAKPCPEQDMRDAIAAGVRQYRLVTAEKEFLRSTLKGVIKVLTDLLALANNTAHERCARIKRLVVDIGRACNMSDPWRLELAVMLSQLGFLILPEQLLAKQLHGQKLSPEQQELYTLHPRLGSDLLANIPRMEELAKVIAYQDKHYDGSGAPPDDVAGESIPLGSRILKAALDFDVLQQQGLSRSKALKTMAQRKGWYDPLVLSRMEPLLNAREGYSPASITPDELQTGMILDQNLGPEAPPKGRPLRVSEVRVARNAAAQQQLQELQVFVPLREPSILDTVDPGLLERIQNQKRLLAAEDQQTAAKDTAAAKETAS